MYTGLNTPEDYLRVVNNHKWMIIVAVVVSTGLSWGLYEWLPKSYRSSVLVQFEEQKVRYVQSVDEPAGDKPEFVMANRVGAMSEWLYKQELLMQVAQEFHLYGYEKEGSTREYDDYIASRMRKEVKFDVKEAPFVRVSFADSSPEMARDVIARLSGLFVKEHSESRAVIAESSSEFLQHELDVLKKKLEVKEKALAEFKQSHLGQLPEQLNSNMHAIDRLETELAAQQEVEKTVSLRLDSVDKAIREYEDPASDVGPQRATKDPRLSRIKQLERNLAALQSTYKESYPDVASVRNEIKKLQAMSTEDYIELYIDQEPAIDSDTGVKRKRKAIDPYKTELTKQREDILRELELVRLRQSRIKAEIRKYEARIEGTTVNQQELMSIQRDYENLQKNYQSILEKKMTIGMASDLEQKSQGTKLRIVQQAGLPNLPEKPNIYFILFGGFGFGCAVGFGSAFGIELLRRGFVSAEEVELTLGLPVLAAISQFESAWPGSAKGSVEPVARKPRLLSLPGLNREDSTTSGAMQVAVGPELVAMWYPRSAVAEQYRVAATRLGLMVDKQKSTVVCISSALMGEGKTSTALNLAHVLSRDLNRKTVLLDCDLKRPMVHAYAGLELAAGVAEVLLGHKTLEECLEYHEQLGVWILPAGIEQSGTAALTHADRLSELIASLRERFDYVVVDSPPLLPVAEAMLIVRSADVVAHVVRARATSRDVVSSAIKMIGQERAVAVILNGVEAQDAPYSYYNYSSRVYESNRKQLR
ncbi:putative Lipopolysaccharide biosynthesis protein [Nitrospira japonica]|uniref:Putative Lipopolysaccharide biosynthesis protein n=1 Tax=Nitrospira japonica TaxID=1325564 RepID=A0A1W1IB41_9BACT|nr:putative Lipopolysaccharide biosynthesis protein [Nitrospira japonica]